MNTKQTISWLPGLILLSLGVKMLMWLFRHQDTERMEWYFPALTVLAGLWWLGTAFFIHRLQLIKVGMPVTSGARQKINSDLPKLMLFTFLAIVLSGLAFYFVQWKLANPESETEWGGLIVLSALALVFTLMCILNWWGYFNKPKG